MILQQWCPRLLLSHEHLAKHLPRQAVWRPSDVRCAISDDVRHDWYVAVCEDCVMVMEYLLGDRQQGDNAELGSKPDANMSWLER